MSDAAAHKKRAALRGPITGLFLRDDTVVYDRDGWYRLHTPSSPWPAVNEVVLSNVGESDPDGEIDRVIAAYRADDLPLKWCVYPWSRPVDLGERLVRRGAIHWPARGMVCDTSLALSVPGDVTTEAITSATLEVYIRAMADGWDMPAPEVAFMRERLGEIIEREPAPVQLFVARRNGEVAGSAATVLHDDFGYLMGANVLPYARGKGVYRALVAGRLAALRDARMVLASTLAREATSAPMLEHLGFETVFRFEMFQLNPRPV